MAAPPDHPHPFGPPLAALPDPAAGPSRAPCPLRPRPYRPSGRPQDRPLLLCTPGDAILRAHDAARRFRDTGVPVISGFHSPIEQECLRILLRGAQPIIICPARALNAMRIPTECRAAFAAGRVLFLSPFSNKPKRVTQDSALRRNEVVAALADEAYLAHIASGGKTDQILKQLREWQVPIL